MSRLVILVGKAGVGKSAIRSRLAPLLGYRSLGPDDFPNRWNDLYWQLDGHDAVLECVQIPSAVRWRMDASTVVIEVTAPQDVRRRRLEAQGLHRLEVAQRLGENPHGTLGYEDRIEPTLQVEAIEDPDALAAQIAKELNGLG